MAKLWLIMFVLLAACATQEPGISPDRDRFYFPTSLAVYHDPGWPAEGSKPSRLYVVNSNADLKFNGGTLMALDIGALPADLSRVGELVSQGKLDCAPARTDSTTWECDEAQFVASGATLRIGDFPSAVRVTRDGKRIFVPVRGDNYLMWADVVELQGGGVDLRCNDDQDAGCGSAGTGDNCDVWDCGATHLVSYSERRQKALPEEPFGVLLNEIVAVHVEEDGRRWTCLDGGAQGEDDCDCGAEETACGPDKVVGCCEPATTHIYVVHLVGGEISFFESGGGGVALKDIQGLLFDGESGIRGGFSMAAQSPGDPEGRVYVSSRVDRSLRSFRIRDNSSVVLDSELPVAALVPGTDNRGLAFGPGGDRMYVVNRDPPSLVAFDMSLEDGLPRGETLWVEEVCAEPSLLRLLSEQELAYVVCFATGQIFVIDTGTGKLVDQIATGDGPNELVLDPLHRRAFIANFLENTVGVIDLDPSHSTYHRMMLRIGRLQNLVRN